MEENLDQSQIIINGLNQSKPKAKRGRKQSSIVHTFFDTKNGESLFSQCGLTMTGLRNRMSPETLENLILIKENLSQLP